MDTNTKPITVQNNSVTSYTGSDGQSYNNPTPSYVNTSQSSVGYNPIPSPYSPSNALGSTPVNTTPNADNLANGKPVTLPPDPTGANNTALKAIGASQGALLGLTGQATDQAQQDYNSSKNQTTDLINTYLGKGNAQLDMENKAGVPQLQSLANSLNNQYLTQGAAYNSQYNSIWNRAAGTAEQKAQEISALQQQHGYDLSNTAIQASIASTNYTNAENIINHQIELKYSPIKDAIDYGMQFLQQNKEILTAKQQNQFNSQLQVQQQTYNQGIYNDHLLSDTKMQMVKDASANGASPEVTNAIWNAPDIGSAGSAGAGFLQSASTYQPVQTGYDVNTGLPIYSGFNSRTGQLEVKNGGGVLGTTGSQQTIISGSDGTSYQMGASTTMGAYASATQTQVNNINATTTKIASTVGVVNDVKTAQLAISKIAQNSPITGQMVMSAAQKYGVDPATLIGVMQAETQLGTDGSKGSKQNNWGNVGNTDSLMASGGSVAMKPQEGVDAVARNLSQRKVQAGQNDPAQPSQTSNLTPQQIAAVTIKNAPSFLQPAMSTAGATGAVYIEQDKLPKSMDIVAQNYASKTGVKILTSAEVAKLKTVDNAMQNVLQVIAPAWGKVANDNRFTQAFALTTYPVSALFDTNYYQERKTFNANKESLAQQVSALSGSSPRLGLLKTAIDALPSTTTDTTADGQAKMQRTLDLLNQTVKKYIPDAPDAKLKTAKPADTYQVNGQSYTVGADGLYYPVTK